MRLRRPPRVQYRLSQVREGLVHAGAVLGGHLEERQAVALGQALALLAGNKELCRFVTPNYALCIMAATATSFSLSVATRESRKFLHI